MTEPTTAQDFHRLARTVERPTKAFIDGRKVDAQSGRTMPSINPATGETQAAIAACGPEDVEAAVLSAERAFLSGEWSARPAGERKRVMRRIAEAMMAHRHELAVLESLDSGKPIRDCLDLDVPEAAATIDWFGEGVDKLYDQLAPTNPAAAGLIVREPIGVVAAVLPWNFPLMMLAWKIGPALATGNSIIIKPAEQTCMTALRVAEIAVEAGLPPGVLNVVPGDGPSAGQPIGLDPRIGAVSFTGSTEVGRLFLRYSAESNLKRVTLECGGKNPTVILSDADPQAAARHSVFAAFWNAGQNCTANSRIIVHRRHHDAVLETLVSETAKWTTGDPLDPGNMLGSLIEDAHRDKVVGHIQAGLREKAKIVFEGRIGTNAGGAFVAPTIFDGVTPDMSIAREEIFGPVTGIMTVEDDEAALRLANDTVYGLQASLYTRDTARALSWARRLQAGTVSVNCYSEGDLSTPFGGFKQSGFGGRDKSVQAYDQYTETKTIWVSLET